MTTGAALFAAEACMGSHAGANVGRAAVVRSARTDESTRERPKEGVHVRDIRVDGNPSSVEKIARLRVDGVDQAR